MCEEDKGLIKHRPSEEEKKKRKKNGTGHMETHTHTHFFLASSCLLAIVCHACAKRLQNFLFSEHNERAAVPAAKQAEQCVLWDSVNRRNQSHSQCSSWPSLAPKTRVTPSVAAVWRENKFKLSFGFVNGHFWPAAVDSAAFDKFSYKSQL